MTEHEHDNDTTKERLEYLRGEIEKEQISMGEIAELETFADQLAIDPGDLQLLEWAGVPETEEYALLYEMRALLDDEDSQTWMDQDPSVAWGDPESQHGRILAILTRAGWERCYHGDAQLHYRVKIRGMEGWRAMQAALDALNPERRKRVEEIAQRISDDDLELWWQWVLPEYLRELGHAGGRVAFSCGRSAGYVNSSYLESRDPIAMVRLGFWLSDQVEGYESREYGESLVAMAIEEDDGKQIQALASPRPDRIEA